MNKKEISNCKAISLIWSISNLYKKLLITGLKIPEVMMEGMVKNNTNIKNNKKNRRNK